MCFFFNDTATTEICTLSLRDALPISRNTIFVLTSDHGEEFLEHGFRGHGPHLYAEVNHVPLMFWGPGIPRVRRVAQPVGHVDLLPTILELAGVRTLGGGLEIGRAHV